MIFSELYLESIKLYKKCKVFCLSKRIQEIKQEDEKSKHDRKIISTIFLCKVRTAYNFAKIVQNWLILKSDPDLSLSGSATLFLNASLCSPSGENTYQFQRTVSHFISSLSKLDQLHLCTVKNTQQQTL